MKTIPTVLITGFVTGLLLLMGGLRADLVVCALILFAIGIVAWTIQQYRHHHLH